MTGKHLSLLMKAYYKAKVYIALYLYYYLALYLGKSKEQLKL